MPDFLNSLSSNPYFSAGFGLVGVTSFIAIGRKFGIAAGKYLKQYYTTSLEITKDDKCYEWVLEYLSDKNMVKTSHKSIATSFLQNDNGSVFIKFSFPPSVGVHFFKYKGMYIKINRNRSSSAQPSKYNDTQFETLNFTTIGRNYSIFENLINEARDHSIKKFIGKTITYIPDSISWRVFGHPKTLRPIHTVILDNHISENIISDVRDFIGSFEWYRERGIPFRRGYLLYGPPGCGKTSLITAIASTLNYNICQLGLGEPGLSDDRFQYLLNTAPLNSIIVLEDVDAVLYDIEQAKRQYRLTYSGLLNALDGIVSSEQRIIFMTTNFIDRLDGALIRPGRVDYKQYIGYLTENQTKRMFQKFYSGISGDEINKFIESFKCMNMEVSPAQLQAYLLKHKNNPESACNDIKNLKNY